MSLSSNAAALVEHARKDEGPGVTSRKTRGYRGSQPRLFHTDSDLVEKTSTEEFSSPFNPAEERLFQQRSTKFAWLFENQLFWLVLYFVFNLALTLYNKGVLVHFPFPYTLTAVHALCGCVGGYLLLETGAFVPRRLSTKENLTLAGFSVLYAVNIVVSNASLHLVTVPFHQVVRAATPFFTIILSACLLDVQSSRAKVTSLLPVIIGVGLATCGDYYFTRWGFTLTLAGTFLAALKTIFTNVLQSPSLPTDRKSSDPPMALRTLPLSRFIPPRMTLHPLDLLIRMSPLAFIQCVFYAYLSGELEDMRNFSAKEMTRPKAAALIANGAIAFGLNVVSFTANKKAGALSMTVAANVKQVLTILLAVFIFDLTITCTNAAGILLTLVGGAWYAKVEYEEKKQRRK